ncbi:MAG: hypothetical protein IJC50_04145 [Clostridia bacterium]|nr:hypothetical protein [Clostridia bacterium]
MKKLMTMLMILILIFAVILLIGCAGKNNTASDDTRIINELEISDEIEESEPIRNDHGVSYDPNAKEDEITVTLPEENEVIGEIFPATESRPYTPWYEHYFQSVFTSYSTELYDDERNEAVSDAWYFYDQEDENWVSRYRNRKWYIVRDLNIPREDIVEYNNKLPDNSGDKMTEEQIDMLYIKDEAEAREAMRNPYTLWSPNEAEIYRMMDILDMDKTEFNSHGFEKEDIMRLLEILDNPDEDFEYPNYLKEVASHIREVYDENADYELEWNEEVGLRWITNILETQPIQQYFQKEFCSVDFQTKDTFVSENEDLVKAYVKAYEERAEFWKSRYKNIMWYIVRDLEISREEYVKYNECLDADMKMTEEQIDMLYIKDEAEAREAMRNPYTLYSRNNKEIIRLYDIEQMTDFRSYIAYYDVDPDDIERLIGVLEDPGLTSDPDYEDEGEYAKQIAEQLRGILSIIRKDETNGF